MDPWETRYVSRVNSIVVDKVQYLTVHGRGG